MRIAVLGAGAMGSLFGGYLSRKNDTVLIDVNREVADRINAQGVLIRETDGTEAVFRIPARTDSRGLEEAELVLVFVKSMFTVSALENNRGLIGKDTYIMTLQNGAGHESKLLKFADRKHVIIGSTQHNSFVCGPGCVTHGGSGPTSIGLLGGNNDFVEGLAENFTECGFECSVSDNIQKQIWHKLFTNTAASALTAVLQVPLGFIAQDKYASGLMERLCGEAVEVANALGLDFDENTVIKEVREVCSKASGGYTSIYADIKNGRRTEVDTISGSVVEAAGELGIKVPYHEMVVSLILALEDRNRLETEGGAVK